MVNVSSLNSNELKKDLLASIQHDKLQDSAVLHSNYDYLRTQVFLSRH